MSNIITGGVTIYEYGKVVASTFGDLSFGSNVITGVPTGGGELDLVRDGQILNLIAGSTGFGGTAYIQSFNLYFGENKDKQTA
jgi:hypothetical protein